MRADWLFANYNQNQPTDKMLTQYIQAAMHRATYELLEDGTFYGEIPDFPRSLL